MNAVCLIVDRLHSGYLGCYGNAWVRTPAFDRLACESFVLDQAVIDSPDLALLYRAYWRGLHALAPESAGGLEPADGWQSLPRALGESGVVTSLLTDDAEVAGIRHAADFSDVIHLPPGDPLGSAASAADTQLAALFAAATDWLATARPPFLLWIHAQGLAAPWDAPLDCRRAYQDDDGVALPDFIQVPSRLLPMDPDPDELLGVRWAYAGQVSLLDRCLQGFWESLQSSPHFEKTLLLVMSARGFPLGEHGWLGSPLEPSSQGRLPPRAWAAANVSRPRLYDELVHVPLFVRLPGGVGAAARSPAIVQPPDLAATLRDWWGLPANESCRGGRSLLPLVREEAELIHDRGCIASPGECAIRTPAWYFRWTPGVEAAPAHPHAELSESPELAGELFVKPDDRHEVSDVADRCPEVVSLLRNAYDDFATAVASEPEAALPLLDEVLASGE